MRLTKDGLVCERAGEDAPEVADRPRSAGALLRFWHRTLTAIDDDYTLGDLMALLRSVEDLENLSSILECDLASLVAEADQARRTGGGPLLEYLQVSNVAEPTTYVEDPSEPDQPLRWLDEDEARERDRLDSGIAAITGEPQPMKLIDATGDDPITGDPARRRLMAPRLHGAWRPPYELIREFEGFGKWQEPHEGYFAKHPEIDPERYEGGFALDLTPIAELLDLPLRYNPTVRFWSGGMGGAGDLLFETSLTITFGEFVRAVFWELGFHGSPADRDAALQSLQARLEAIERRERDPER